MKNRWKASVKTEEGISQIEKPKNNSKKIGIAMGIVGAVLVTAGVAPMFFGADNLEGDLTAQNQEEAVDPLVALLSGGNNSMVDAVATPVVSPKVTKAPNVTPTAVPTVAAKVTTTSTPKPSVATKSAKKLAEVDKILEEEGEIVAENKNIGKSDKTGSAFGTAETMHSAAGLSNSSAKTVKKSQPKPKTNVQTGNNTSLVLGFLFLILSGMISFTGFLRRKV